MPRFTFEDEATSTAAPAAAGRYVFEDGPAAPAPPAPAGDDFSTSVRKFFDPGYGSSEPAGMGNVGRQMLKAASFLVPAAKVGQGAGLLAKVVAGAKAGAPAGALYGLGASESDTLSGNLEDAASGAVGGLVAGGTIPVVAKGVGTVLRGAANKLASLAETAAVRSANADRTAYRAAFGKPANLEKIHETGRMLLESGVKLRTPAAMQESLAEILTSTGQKIGDLAGAATKSGAVADLEGAALKALQHPDVAGLASNTETRALGQRVAAFLDDQVQQHGNEVTPELLWSIRRQLDPLSKWSKDAPEAITKAFRAVRSTLDAELGASMGRAGLGAEWATANKGFALAKTAKKLADVGAERRAGNRLGSPSEKGAALAGGVSAALGNPIGALAIPAATVAANRASMPVAATTANWLSGVLQPPAAAAARSPVAQAATVPLSQELAAFAEYLRRIGLTRATAEDEEGR